MAAGREPQPHSEELFISIKALRETVGPAFEVASDRQLFGYLTRWLDTYMLKTISWEHFGVGPPLSFNINLETLRTPEFAEFENRRPPAWRDRIMLELQLSDVLGRFPGLPGDEPAPEGERIPSLHRRRRVQRAQIPQPAPARR